MKRVLIGFGIVFGVLLVLVLLLPTVLSTGAVRRAVVKRVNASGTGTLAIEHWSLGWWRGVRVVGLQYDDSQKRFGVNVQSVTISSGLLRLLAPVKNLGVISVNSPHAWCQVDLLEAKPLAEPKGQPPSTKPTPKPTPMPKPEEPTGVKLPLALDVVAKLALRDGQIEVRKTGQPNTVVALEADVDCPSLKKPIEFKMAGRTAVGAPPATTGTPELQLNGNVLLLKDGAFDPAAIVGELALQAQKFDLASLALAKVYVPAMPATAGLLNANVTAKMNGSSALALDGEVVVLGLSLEGGALGPDKLRANSMRLDLDVGSEGQDVIIRGVTLQSPFVTIKLDGQFTPVAGAKYPSGHLAMTGDVNLPALAAQLPNTLKLRKDIAVQGGQIHLDGKIETAADVAKLHANVAIKDLQGTQGTLAFQQSAPVEVSVAGAMLKDGPVVESFDLKSGFATASGSGNATGAVVTVDADLAAAAKEIGQVVDLGALRLAGKLRGTVRADLQSAEARSVALDAGIAGLSVGGLSSIASNPAIPDLSCNLAVQTQVQIGKAAVKWLADVVLDNVAGTRAGHTGALSAPIRLNTKGSAAGSLVQVDSAKVDAGFLMLDANGDAQKAALTAQLDLGRAQAELSQFIDFGNRRAEGTLNAKLGMASPSVSERQIDVDVRVAKLVLAGVTPQPIRRDLVHLANSGVIRLSPEWKVTGLRALQVAFDGLPLELKLQVAEFILPDAGAHTALRVDDASIQANGTLEGVLGFCREAGLAKQDLPLKGPIGLDAKISTTPEGLEIKNLALNSTPLALQAAGSLHDPEGKRRLQLQGKLSSDCSEIAMLVESFAGYRPELTGKATRDFSLDTTLGAGDWQAILRQTEASGALHADSFSSFGMSASNIDLTVGVHAGRAEVVIDTAVNGGHVHAAPYLDLTESKTVLSMAPNSRILEDVQLSRDMAAELLARIHPIFYGCAVVGGKLNLTMERLHAPLGPRLKQDTTFLGQMELKDLRLGPGTGLLGKLLSLSQTTAQELVITNQVIRFECRDGRITSSPLVIRAQDSQLTFSGSVGLDQTIAYVAELPLTAKLVHRETLPPALQNQKIAVTIGGTVSSPRFDDKAFLRSAAEFGLKAAGNTLLDDYLKKKSPQGTPAGAPPAETPPSGTTPPAKKSPQDEAIDQGMKILGDFLRKPKSSP